MCFVYMTHSGRRHERERVSVKSGEEDFKHGAVLCGARAGPRTAHFTEKSSCN